MKLTAAAALWASQTELTRSFEHREYRALWSASALSAIAFQAGGGSIAVGLVVFATMLPSVFVPAFGGVLADRFNRRTVSTFTLAVALITAVLMALLIILDQAPVWHPFVLSLINGAARAVEMPVALFAAIMLLTLLGYTLRGVYRRGALPVLSSASAGD